MAVRPPAPALAHLEAVLPRWPSSPERWHVTLTFLGEVAEPATVASRLRPPAAGHRPLELRLAGCGTFGRGGPVWVGLAGELAGLHALAEAVARAARSAGVLLEDRPYRPHLTVGRGGTPDPALLADYEGPPWVADEVELVSSSHVGRAVVHTVLERFPLTG